MASTKVHPRKARLLMVHGYTQSAAIFKNKTGSLRKAIKSRAETVFVDGPFVIEGAATVDTTVTTLDDGAGATSPSSAAPPPQPRSWWRLGGDARYPSETAEYSGFEVAYEQLVGELRRHSVSCPVDGLLGFSQGASSIGLLLTRMAASDRDRDLLQGLRFAVLVGGFLPNHAGWAGEIKAGLPPNLRTLHVYGTTDRMVTEERSLAFLAAFEAASPALTERFVHQGGHFVPTCTGIFRDALRDFVDRAMAVEPHAAE